MTLAVHQNGRIGNSALCLSIHRLWASWFTQQESATHNPLAQCIGSWVTGYPGSLNAPKALIRAP